MRSAVACRVYATETNLALLLGHTDGAALAAGRLGPLATHAQAPIVPQTTVGTNLLEALKVLAQLHVERVGHYLTELAILDILLPVQHPIRHLELARVLDDRHQTLNLLLRKLTGPLAQLNLSLLAADVREAAANTLDGGEGKHRLHLTVKVSVQHTQNVLEVGLVHDERHDEQRGQQWKAL